MAYPISWAPVISAPYSLCGLCTFASGPQSCLQWSILRVWRSPVWGGRGQIPSPNCSALGLWWPSMPSCCPSMGGVMPQSSPHPRGSPILLRCTPHQLARGVRLPCHSNWCIMGRVLSLTSEPSAVGGSNGPLPCLHQGEEANIEVGRARDPLRKDLLHMGLDSIRGVLLQTPMALLVIEEQVSSTRAIYLHMFQLLKNWIALEYMHDHPHIPRECGRVGSTRVVSHCHFQHQGIFFC